jgi:hypothetical protein
MPKSFSRKTIQLAVTLSQGGFGGGGNTKIIEGLACEVMVEKPGLPEKNSLRAKVWGMKYDDMAQLTMLAFKPLESQKNLIEVRAGEIGETGNSIVSLVFQGEITAAFADFNSAPDVAMEFEADSGSYPNQIASPTATVSGDAPAANLFARFASEAGYEYKNEGVEASVKDAWFPGSPIEKAMKLARDIGCELIIDDGIIITMPGGKAREGNAVLLNKDNGLIGYPTFNQDGIVCRCRFNPDVQSGGLIKVESIVPKAGGVWKISKLSHNLSAYVPGGGSWESQIEAAYNE